VRVGMTDPKAYFEADTFSIPMKLDADTEISKAYVESNKSLECMTPIAPLRLVMRQF
jgi:hypothetical protein